MQTILKVNMRPAFLFLLCIMLISLISCSKNDVGELEKEVETYIIQLRQGNYSDWNLPALSHEAIPFLLRYRNDETMINAFPRNPISSYAFQECRLGIMVLWTIESIRAVANESPYLFMRFPSLNPILFNESNLAKPEHENHKMAANAYAQWWNQHIRQEFRTFKHLDPLKETGLRWN
jgi:hypothetical protein